MWLMTSEARAMPNVQVTVMMLPLSVPSSFLGGSSE